MTATFLTDEHVPSVFITALRSSGYDVERANDTFGEATDDERLLEYCAKNGHLLVTHDKKDFGVHSGMQSITPVSSSTQTRYSSVMRRRRRSGHWNASSITTPWTNSRASASGSTSGDEPTIRMVQ